MSFGRKKRRAAVAPPPPVIPGLNSSGNFISGMTPYAGPPPMAQQNTWEGGNFVIPGRGTAMSNDVLARFPQLASLFSGGPVQMGAEQKGMQQNDPYAELRKFTQLSGR